jgi:penicillin-binding protein 2
MNAFTNRRYYIAALFALVSLVLIAKLFWIQVIESSYQYSAYNNTLRKIIQYPARGLIYDRNHKLLVANQASYDLMLNPSQLEPFDTTEFCEILNIDKSYLVTKVNEAKRYSYYKPSIILKQVSSKTYAVMQEKLYKYPGFFVQPRTIREYPTNIASHVLGYVGEVDSSVINRNKYYSQGDYIGKTGIERSYEDVLRGKKGQKIYLVDVHNRIKGSFKNGKNDVPAEVGKDIITTIDAGLQKYGEKLMEKKVGSIVAIEPATGEILALISNPDYNPDFLTGRKRTVYYSKLIRDTLNPLFNRALMAKYPPGSTFKPMNALIGLHEDVITPYTFFYCYNGFYARGVHVGCHNHPTPLDLPGSIQASCNAYYCKAFIRILSNPKYDGIHEAFTNWRDHVMSFNLGHKITIDLPNELSGNIPDTSYYDRYYGKKGWSPLTVISLSIGQGEIETTPLQMANMTAAIANRGTYYIPHVVKKIQGEQTINNRFKKMQRTSVDPATFDPVIEGMYKVVNGVPGSGSTARIAKIEDIEVCGKTGTAQNPHGDDHSIFISFAPKDTAKIAISVYVENAGYGSTVAAPIASLMIEKYLKNEVTRTWLENYILEKDLIHHAKEN